MQRILAITRLTWKAAFRFRLFWVLLGLLLASVVVLPLLLKDDGTARGFIQIMLTYTLSVITALLGFSTLWLACGTLARDIEDCQIQVVVVKPVARWEVWVGKWLGIMLLNATLLAVSGTCVFGLLKWRASQLEPRQQQILREEIFVSRGSLREPMPDIDADVQRAMQRAPNREKMSPEELLQTQQMLKERITGMQQVVPPNHLRLWNLDLGLKKHLLSDQPLFMRVKFYVAQTNASGTYLGIWTVGPTNSPLGRSLPQSLAASTIHEIRLPPGLIDQNGILTVIFENRNPMELIFPLEDGFEVLYREGTFGLNFARGLAIILCWLAALAALGLAASSLMSFPVAAFFSFSLLVMALSSGTLSSVVQEGTVMGIDHETGEGGGTLIDKVMLPFFKLMLSAVKLAQDFSPIDALSTGRSITWGQLAQAIGQIVLLLGGLFAAAGIYFFNRRELATAQGQH